MIREVKATGDHHHRGRAATAPAATAATAGRPPPPSWTSPSGVAVDAAGDLFIADSGNNVVREVNARPAIITTVAGNGTAGYSGDGGPATAAELNDPDGVAVDSAGDLFIADSGNNVIREVDSSTGDHHHRRRQTAPPATAATAGRPPPPS